VEAPAEDLLAAVLDEDLVVVSEEVPWAAGSTEEVDIGNCRKPLNRNCNGWQHTLPAVFLWSD
jgi:hypothetical protein